MIDAPAGTDKNYTICAISSNLWAQGKLVLCAASTGIAGLLLPGGLTAHSTFKLPFGDMPPRVAFAVSMPSLNALKYSREPP